MREAQIQVLLRRGLERAEIAERNIGQRVGQHGKIRHHLRKPRAAFAPPLVHVDRAVELDLDGVQSACRIAVMLGDETAGIGLVAADRIAERLRVSSTLSGSRAAQEVP